MKLPTVSALATIVLFSCNALPRSSAAGSGEGQRAFEIADFYRSAGVGAPRWSPDGKSAVFAVQRYDLEAGKSWSEIWMMAADGSNLRQMTQGRFNDTNPQYTPKGEAILFTSTRSGSSQLWTIAVDGGEARALTSFALDLADPVCSPDGKWIAVSADVYPECGADGEANKKIADGIEKGKLKVHVADELLYRHWTSWKDGQRTHILLVDAASGDVKKDLTPGDFDSPVFSLGERGYDISPDGKELCFVSNRDPNPASSTNADLWTVPLEGEGEPLNITAANKGWDGAPRYSPDGRSIAYVSQATPAYESDLRRLAVYERASKSWRYLTSRGAFDDWVTEHAWSPDSRSIYFQADHHGRTPVYKVAAAGGKVAPVFTHAFLNGWEVSRDGSIILYSRRGVGEPAEIFRVASSGGQATRLTHFNAELEAEVDIRPVEELWVQGDGNYKVHVFLVKPHGFDPSEKYPLILNVHGGPQSQWADSYRGDWQVYPGKGYIVAFPNPTGSTGYGQDFTDAIARDYGGRVYRDLMKVTDELQKLPYVDKDRMGAMGWSYGGYMMMWLQGHTTRFKCIAAMMGVFDLPSFYGATEELWFPEHDMGGAPWESADYVKWSPSQFVKEFKTPSLVITGEKDYRVPYTQSLGYFTALKKRGVPARLIVFPNAGHWPAWNEMAFYYNAHLDFFHEWLGGEKAPWDPKELARNKRVEVKE